jgi:DNA-binding beta-propeller fold protein YncE
MRTAFFDGLRLRRIARLGSALAAVVSLWLSLGSVSALAAAEAHPKVGEFGSFSNPNGIAVDESTGDVYVADIGTDTVYKFDAQGNPVSFSSLGGNALSGSATPAGSFSFPAESGNLAAIAVDNSTSPADPSAGDLYVMDAGHGVIDKFSSSGAYISQIGGPLSGAQLLGLGVDGDGDLRVYADIGFQEKIDVFDSSAENAFVTSLDPGYEKEEGILREPGHGFALSPTDDMYLLESCGCMEKRGGNMEPLGRVDPGPSAVAAAVDPATGHLYVDDQSSVAEWDTGTMNGQVTPFTNFEDVSSGELVSSFGSTQLSGAPEEGGIAVNGVSGKIYLSNAADGTVYVFGSSGPAVAAGVATGVTKTTATLQGTIDPRGVPVTSCQFEYEVVDSAKFRLPVGGYGQQVPCDQTAAQIGSAKGRVPVTAEISGLTPGKLYDFRVVAGSSTGTNSSGGRFATAGPGFGIKSFDVSFFNEDGSPDTQAGSHPYRMVTSIVLNTAAIQREKTADSRYVDLPDGNVRDIVTDLPPGLVGDPNATAMKCTLAQLEHVGGETGGGGHCPPESQVGELEAQFGEGAVEPTLKEPVYNTVPPPGVAAQIGANFVLPEVFVDVGVHAGGDYPLQASAVGISGLEPLIATRLTIFGLVGQANYGNEVINGNVDSRKPFLTLPTGCTGPLKSTVRANSYQNPDSFVEEKTMTHDGAGQPLALTGCSKLEFPPTITVSPDSTDASTSSGLTVGVHVSQKAAFNPEGLAESALRDTTVTLPEGVALNPAGADGLEACSEGLAGFTGFDEFNSEFEPGVKTATFTPEMPSPLQPGSNFCPEGSKIGTVQIKTPLLPDPLEGAVYLAAQNANPFGSLVAMYMFVEDPVSGSIIKLTGEVKLSDTGQIVTTFKNTPDLPFEDLELHFFGGERAPLSTPSRCGTYTTKAVFVPWDGNGPVEPTSSFTIDHGPNGGPCPGASLPFNPSLTAGTTNIQAGAFSPFTMTMSRADGQQNLQAISLKMPPGLSGLLTGVELCGEAQANAGTCGPNSLIGETIVSVGVGNAPFTVTGGKVYLTGPYKGAPFGLSIVNPAKAGPYDLGQVIVRAKIEVDPVTADLMVTSDNEGLYKIPTIIDGIPLQIKHVNVTINRSGFTFNPTNCNPMSITGSLDSTEGSTQALSVPFQATNCAALAFKPGFKVSTSGKTSRSKGASLSVKLTYPRAPFGSQANIKSVKVDLPRQLPSRLTTLQKACTDHTFNHNPAACPAASIVGHAKAVTPLIPVPLEGPAYFVSHGGAKFPELVIVLQGYGVTLDLHGETFISKAGITSSTFHTVPDAPVGSFELMLPEGANSALAANGNLCSLTKTVLVKRKMTVRSKGGHKKTVTRKVRKTLAAGLVMPTAFTAQNGAVIKQNTPISVTGCAKAKHKTKGSKAKHKTKHKTEGSKAKKHR